MNPSSSKPGSSSNAANGNDFLLIILSFLTHTLFERAAKFPSHKIERILLGWVPLDAHTPAKSPHQNILESLSNAVRGQARMSSPYKHPLPSHLVTPAQNARAMAALDAVPPSPSQRATIRVLYASPPLPSAHNTPSPAQYAVCLSRPRGQMPSTSPHPVKSRSNH